MDFADLRQATERLLDHARQLPPDELLVGAGVAAVLFVLALLAWTRAARRAGRLRRDLAEAHRQQAAVQEKYEAELKWRLAGERQANPTAPTIEG